MKIVAGLGSVDAYAPYVAAGADEVFCGYVPESWAAHYGMALPLNRRETRYYPAQIGARSELLLLAGQVRQYGVPVSITLNSLHYRPEQYPLLAELVSQCITDGFSSFIVADPALLVYLHAQGLDKQAHIHVSGEIGEVNRGMIALCRELGAQRIIFHRKTTLDDMAACIRYARGQAALSAMTFEAFALNEMCHFSGAFCNSLHCDELAHMCRVPYRLGSVREGSPLREPGTSPWDPAQLGSSGCGLCALWRLRQAGVTHLKLVGRGNHPECMLRDIRALRRALELLEGAGDQHAYIGAMKEQLFPGGCSGNCYYLDEW